MRVVIIALIAVALMAAGGTAFLVKRLLEARPAPQAVAEAPKEAAKTFVLVAARDLPAGTTIGSGNLRWQPWPEGATAKGFVVATDRDKKLEQQFIDTVVRRGIVEGTPLMQTMVFKRGEPGFLAGALDPGMRAIAVKVTPESSAAGFILPGDRVDVMLAYTFKIEKEKDKDKEKKGKEEEAKAFQDALFGKEGHVSRAIVRDVRVLAVDQKVDEFEQKASVGKTVTLELTPKQAEIIALAATMGTLSLALRSLSLESASSGDENSFTDEFEVMPASFLPLLANTKLRILDAIEGVQAPAATASEARPKTPAAPPPAESAKVKVYRGSQPSVQEFPAR